VPDAAPNRPEDPPGVLRRMASKVTPGAGGRQVLGIVLLLTLVAVVVAALFLGVQRSRSAYLEQRNLRELDRVAANISSTSQTLGSVASLYFNPAQLHFALTPATECLMASARIQRTANMSIDIRYYFVDVAPPTATPLGDEKGGGGGIAGGGGEGGAKEPSAKDSTSPPALAAQAAGGGALCPFEARLQSVAGGEALTIDDRQIRVNQWLPLRDLIRPMLGDAGAGPDPATLAREVLAREADRRIERGGFGPGASDADPAIVRRSLETAFRRNAVRTEVSVSNAALDLDTSLETFDAIQIFGEKKKADGSSAPALLFQAGQLPPAIKASEEGAGASFLETLLKTGGQDEATETKGAKKGQRAYQKPEESGSLLMGSTVYPAGDLMIFEKKYASLGGFGCSVAEPCRIIGIITDRRFGNSVRKFEGMQSTFFLIAVLALVALLPLIHLSLRKRLDAIGRRAQFVMWFSMTLLAASAMIASLTIWAAAISRSESAGYAGKEAERIRSAFATELDSSLRLITEMSAALGTSTAVYPAPAIVRWSTGIPPGARDAAILDTAGFFRGDGYSARDMKRFADLAMPPFGTNIADRPYFLRAQGGGFDVTRLRSGRPCYGKAEGLKFVIDRVVARPDGVAKTVFLMPPQRGCVRMPRPAGRSYDATDPAASQWLLATGYLRTFIAANLHPGFGYAVIDVGRPEGEPDILFSDRKSAELSEEFERDLDDRESFRIITEQLRLDPKAPARRLTTHYRGDPVRLTLTRLHDDVDWILVVIESRNDSGYAVWRAATFGFVTWLAALALVFGINIVARLRNREALDKRPGLWLWPVEIITDFTPPRFAFEDEKRGQLADAANRRDGHMLRLLVAGALGVLAAEGASRTMLALAIVMAAFAARAYFRGLTATDKAAACRLDRAFVRLATLLILLSALLFAAAWLAPGPNDRLSSQPLRALLYAGSLLFLIRPLADARRAAREKGRRAWLTPRWLGSAFAGLDKLINKAESLVTRPFRRPGAPRKRSRPNPVRMGWMLVLLAIGTLPAAAGFLDSIDNDAALVAEREADRAAFAQERRREAVDSIGVGRQRALAPSAQARLEQGVLPGEQSAEPGTAAGGRSFWDVRVADLSMRAVDLHQTALAFSDFRRFHMRDGFLAALRHPDALVAGLILMALPFILLFGALSYFRRQYFTAPPRTPVITSDEFGPPLTCARRDFLGKVLVPAASGKAGKIPFDDSPSHRHLVLGIDLDIREEQELASVRERIAWVNMLDLVAGGEPPRALPKGVNAVVIGNLDIALQLPEGDQIKRVFKAMQGLVDSARLHANPKRHIFILSDVEPLDRIALLRCRNDEEVLGTIEDWRWAALLQDFTLIAVVPTLPLAGAEPTPTCAERELLVINTVFAKQLLAQLRASSPGGSGHDYESRVIDYVAEQMADYYHRVWASSSDEERVILYHIAWRRHLKMTDGPALRSLLVRGLIVRTPEYRLMNKSFARYVRRIERLERIRKRAKDANGMDTIWPLIRVPLIVFTLALLVIVQLISPRHATGALGIVPAMGAIIPALLANWLRTKAAEA
jgi:hypothetical protein